jgi:hypothetical protein
MSTIYRFSPVLADVTQIKNLVRNEFGVKRTEGVGQTSYRTIVTGNSRFLAQNYLARFSDKNTSSCWDTRRASLLV